ncbi:DUF2090 domain-containing protein [Candidatus Woesearchaeota archaeon]|nr:DUF2090 domain-containing protein [Candidatus Woesearchaeota archaeon]
MEKKLLILPFDHRSTFIKGLFGYKGSLSKKQTGNITKYKEIIWEAFVKVHKKQKKGLGILVDEQFGSGILRKAAALGVVRVMATEKSGQEVFDFEYGADFGKHILKFKPDYAKVLVRYNPENKKDNLLQLKRLKKLNDFCKSKKIGFLFELLVPATKSQAKKNYDSTLRPKLTLKAIQEIKKAGIAPDIWKLEPMPNKDSWKKIIGAIKNAKIIVLGRAGSKNDVVRWLKTASAFKEVIGFAIGRTIFFNPLKKYHSGKISRKQAVDKIAEEFEYFVKLWNNLKST